MSDCLPCRKNIDPAFLELIKQRKKEAQEQLQKEKADQGISITPNKEDQVEISGNLYKVVSRQHNKIVVSYDGPIMPRRE